MANTRSAAKRARQTVRRTARNKAVKTLLKSRQRNAREAVAKGDKTAAGAALSQMHSALDRAAKAGVIHKNTAARQKGKLQKAFSKLA